MAKLNYTAIIITVIVVLAVFGALSYLYPRQPSRTIDATGTATLTVPPDEAVAYLQIQTNDTTAQAAKDDNTNIQNSVISGLKTIGVQDKDIETQNYNIYQNCQWIDNSNVCKGFVASIMLKVSTKDFTNLGKIVDAGVNNGALVSYINFELSPEKTSEYKAQALKQASADAKTKANAVAAGQGMTAGNLVSISSSEFNYAPVPLYARTAEASGASVKQAVTNINPSNLDISATVTAVYELK